MPYPTNAYMMLKQQWKFTPNSYSISNVRDELSLLFCALWKKIEVVIGCLSKDCWKIISWVNVRSIALYFADISSLAVPPAQLESKLESPNKHNQRSIAIDCWSNWVLFQVSTSPERGGGERKEKYFLYFCDLNDTFLILHSLCLLSFFLLWFHIASIGLLYYITFTVTQRHIQLKKMVVPLMIIFILLFNSLS